MAMENKKAFDIFRKAVHIYCDRHKIPTMFDDKMPQILKDNMKIYGSFEMRVSVKYGEMGIPRILVYSIYDEDVYCKIANPNGKCDKAVLSVWTGDDSKSDDIAKELVGIIGSLMKKWDMPETRLARAIFGEDYYESGI